MNLTPELKARIDAMSYEALLAQWRHAPIGTGLFQGESGEYFTKRMAELRARPETDHVAASKSVGW